MDNILSRVKCTLWFLFGLFPCGVLSSPNPSSINLEKKFFRPTMFHCVRCGGVFEKNIDYHSRIEITQTGKNGYLLGCEGVCPRCNMGYLLKVHDKRPIDNQLCPWCGGKHWNATLASCSICGGPLRI